MGVSSAFSFIVPYNLGGPTTISFYGSSTADGDFFPIYLSDGSPASINITAGRIQVAFPELFSIPLLKATSTIAFDAIVLAKG